MIPALVVLPVAIAANQPAAQPAHIEARHEVVVERAPAPRFEHADYRLRPSPHHVWESGHWVRERREWVWVPGRWTRR